MTPQLALFIIIASGLLLAALVLFTLGLCRAAADTRDVREDTGEYDG
jgi:hypothetical protein